jgi:hypothetical protein
VLAVDGCLFFSQIRFSDKILQREKKKFADETPEIGLGFITIIISAIFIGVGLNGFSEFRMVSWNARSTIY